MLELKLGINPLFSSTSMGLYFSIVFLEPSIASYSAPSISKYNKSHPWYKLDRLSTVTVGTPSSDVIVTLEAPQFLSSKFIEQEPFNECIIA